MITAINEVTYTSTPIEINGALPTIVLAFIMLALIGSTIYWAITNRDTTTATKTQNVAPMLTRNGH